MIYVFLGYCVLNFNPFPWALVLTPFQNQISCTLFLALGADTNAHKGDKFTVNL